MSGGIGEIRGGNFTEQLKDFADLPVTPATNIPNWSLWEVSELGNEPLELNLAILSRLPQSVITLDFQCNDGWICRDQQWEGVTVKSLLENFDLSGDVRNVEFISGTRQVNLTIEESLDSSVIVALKLNGQAIPTENGGPCCLLSGHRTGPSHLKWLEGIKLVGAI